MTRKTDLTDLSEAEWHRLSRLVPGPKPGGRLLKYPRRAVLKAIFYLVRAGCPWRLLPSDLPPWRIVYHYFRAWTQSGWWQHLHDHLVTNCVFKKDGVRNPVRAFWILKASRRLL